MQFAKTEGNFEERNEICDNRTKLPRTEFTTEDLTGDTTIHGEKDSKNFMWSKASSKGKRLRRKLLLPGKMLLAKKQKSDILDVDEVLKIALTKELKPVKWIGVENISKSKSGEKVSTLTN